MVDFYDKLLKGMSYSQIQELNKSLKTFANLSNIKREIYINYNDFVKKNILKEFNQIYGNTNYDEESLINSLEFKNTTDIRPDFSYNKNKFKWNKDIRKDTYPFNSSESKNYSSLTNLDDIEDYDNLTQDDIVIDKNYIDYSQQSSKGDFSFYNKLNRQGAFQSLENAYKKTYKKINEQFDKELKNNLLEKINKKLK